MHTTWSGAKPNRKFAMVGAWTPVWRCCSNHALAQCQMRHQPLSAAMTFSATASELMGFWAAQNTVVTLMQTSERARAQTPCGLRRNFALMMALHEQHNTVHCTAAVKIFAPGR